MLPSIRQVMMMDDDDQQNIGEILTKNICNTQQGRGIQTTGKGGGAAAAAKKGGLKKVGSVFVCGRKSIALPYNHYY